MKKKNKVTKAIESLHKYSEELNKLGYIGFGSSLTIYRDGINKDDDLDFIVFEDKWGKGLENFLAKFPIFRKEKAYYFEDELQEITVSYKGINIDFSKGEKRLFIFDRPKMRGGCTRLWICHHQEPKLKKYKKINIVSDEKWFEDQYGTEWKIPKKMLKGVDWNYSTDSNRVEEIFDEKEKKKVKIKPLSKKSMIGYIRKNYKSSNSKEELVFLKKTHKENFKFSFLKSLFWQKLYRFLMKKKGE